jgi:phenylpyruvate tautomerase PptA (4-oxalocrotonate tautomerase family)
MITPTPIIVDGVTIVIYIGITVVILNGLPRVSDHFSPIWRFPMPLTLIVTEGVLPKDREARTIAQLSEAFLKLHGLHGNQFMTPNVIGHVQVIPAGSTFSGLKPTPVAIVEWLTPSFAFASSEVQRAYVKEATDIVYEAAGGKQPRENIWINLKYAVDGMWGIGGKAFSNAELGAAVANG